MTDIAHRVINPFLFSDSDEYQLWEYLAAIHPNGADTQTFLEDAVRYMKEELGYQKKASDDEREEARQEGFDQCLEEVKPAVTKALAAIDNMTEILAPFAALHDDMKQLQEALGKLEET